MKLHQHLPANIAAFLGKFKDSWEKVVIGNSEFFPKVHACQLVINMHDLKKTDFELIENEVLKRTFESVIGNFYKAQYGGNYEMRSEFNSGGKDDDGYYIYTITIKADDKQAQDVLLKNLTELHSELKDCCLEEKHLTI